jgi:RHS repeat-associated protein
VVQQIDGYGSALASTTTRTYDRAGNLLSETTGQSTTLSYAHPATTSFAYDALGRQVESIEGYGLGSQQRTTQFSYNAAGNQVTQTLPSGATTTLLYDARNRQTGSIDPLGHRGSSTYDAAGNLLQTTDANNNSVTYAYDALNRQSSSTDATHAVTAYAYDAADRLSGITQTSSSGAVLASYAYSYDPGNRLSSETVDGVTTSYSYNGADELTADGSVTFSYDPAGNRTNSGYQTGPGNEVLNDGTWTYSYDAAGELTRKSKGANAETWTYGYDLAGHLLWAKQQATDGGTLLSLTSYVYDVAGNLLERDGWTQQTGVTSVQRWGYDGSNAWLEVDGTGKVLMRRVYRDGPDQVLARVDGSGVLAWYLTDREGSVRDVVSWGGTLVLDQVSYSAYGQVTVETNAAAGDAYKYNGGWQDAQTGLVRFGERWYNPATGSWITRYVGAATRSPATRCGIRNISQNGCKWELRLADQMGNKPGIWISGGLDRAACDNLVSAVHLWGRRSEIEADTAEQAPGEWDSIRYSMV